MFLIAKHLQFLTFCSIFKDIFVRFFLNFRNRKNVFYFLFIDDDSSRRIIKGANKHSKKNKDVLDDPVEENAQNDLRLNVWISYSKLLYQYCTMYVNFVKK